MNKTLKEQYKILNEEHDNSKEFWHFDSDEIVDRTMGKIHIRHKGYFWIVDNIIERWGDAFHLSQEERELFGKVYDSKDYEEYVKLLDDYHIRWCFLFWDEYEVKDSKRDYSRYIISDTDEKISYGINGGSDIWISSEGSKELDIYTTLMLYNDKYATIKKVSDNE